MEHYRDDTYEPVGDQHARVVCGCRWRSETIAVMYEQGTKLLTDQSMAVVDELWDDHIGPLTTPDPSTVLILVTDGGGPRHYLGGEPVTAGTPLELLLPDGSWWRGRYESSWKDGHPTPMFYAMLGGPAADNNAPEYTPQVGFELPGRAVLRRPDRR